jgi:hypothetical protein
MGLQQTSPSGAGSKAGLEVMPTDGVTLSDGRSQGEHTPTRRSGVPVSACRGDIGAAPDGLFCRAEDVPAGHQCHHCSGLGARHEPRPAGRSGLLWWCASP